MLDGASVPPMAEGRIRAILVDDHDLFRRGLRELLEEQGIAVVGEADDGEEGIRLARHASPDVVVLDLNMPRMDGVTATRRLRDAVPSAQVLVLTVSEDDEAAVRALLAGASGYLVKDASIAEIAAAVRAAAAGEVPLSPRIGSGVVERLRSSGGAESGRHDELSERELEVLGLIAEGRDNSEIAATLVISPQTVKAHVSSILAKLGLENRVQAAVYAVRNGLV
jgi:two-component system, NarL family, response regulator LiaR